MANPSMLSEPLSDDDDTLLYELNQHGPRWRVEQTVDGSAGWACPRDAQPVADDGTGDDSSTSGEMAALTAMLTALRWFDLRALRDLIWLHPLLSPSSRFGSAPLLLHGL